MRIKDAIRAVTAMSLISAPVVAQAAPVPIEQARVGSEVEGESLRGGVLMPLLFLVAAVLAVILLTDGGEEPVSP